MTTLSQLPWKRSAQPVEEEGERLLDACGTHWVKYVPSVSLYALLMIVSGWLLYVMYDQSDAVRLSGGLPLITVMVFVQHWFFRRMLSLSLDGIIFTTQRIIVLKTDLWVDDETTEFPLPPVRTVDASKRGVWQHLLNYGTLSFDLPDSAIRLVPNPHHRAAMLTAHLKEQHGATRFTSPASYDGHAHGA